MKQLFSYHFFMTPEMRRSKWIIIAIAVFILVLGFLHIVIGTEPLIVIIAATTILLSFYPIAKYSFLNLSAVLISLLGFRYVGFPFCAKLVMGQPLDTHLLDPIGSYGVVLIGITGYLGALGISEKVSLGQPLLKPDDSSVIVRRISLMATFIGIAANLTVAFRAGDYYNGLTIAEFFVPFLHLGLISAIARVLYATNMKRSIDTWVIFILLSEIAFAMVQNSRMALMETLMCYITTVVAFETTIKWRQLFVTMIFITVMVMFVTPIFLYVRESRDSMSWTQRIKATMQMSTRWREAFTYYQNHSALVDQLGWYLNYYGSPRNAFERMTLVNHVDVLKVGTETYGNVGIEDLSLSFKRAMPRFLVPDKPRDYGQGSWLYENLGLINLGPFETAPLIGTGYVAFGWTGTFLYPFFLGMVWLLTIKKISGCSLRRNVWAIYLFIRLHNHFVEGSSDVYLLYILRSFPQDFVLLYFISIVAKGSFHRSWIKKTVHVYG